MIASRTVLPPTLNWIRNALLPLWVITLCWPVRAQTDPGFRATYQLTFDASWSAASHPEQFPSGPHFSGLIGATHDQSGTLWRQGELASQGIELMAELGSTSSLRQEIESLIEAGIAESIVAGSGIGNSPGTTSLSFEISQRYPRVSITSMLAPSPDWFVGTDSLNLRQDGAWIEQLTVDLLVYDAGTDSGENYIAANADSNPPEPISLIEQGPLSNGIPVGQFRFQLQSLSDYFPIGGAQSGVYYHPDRDGEGVNLIVGSVAGRLVFTVTWFTYANGQQLWLVGNSDLEAGTDTAVVELFETGGADFGDGFNPDDVERLPWGTATFRFPACGQVDLDYDGGVSHGTGQRQLVQLVNVAEAICE